MNSQTIKNKIRNVLMESPFIDSDLGKINIEKELGEGGNALVYNSLLGNNHLALKILAEKVGTTKYKRFLLEFREIVQLADTGAVVPIYYFNHLNIDDEKYAYIIMKKYPYTLKSWYDSGKITTVENVFNILKSLLDIIQIIHEKNIVHRDLKPENVLVTNDGKLVLADFGISWFDPEIYQRQVKTEKSDRMANLNFSAPEQFEKGATPHPTMDIFALGQLVTWIITGKTARGDREILNTFNEKYKILEPTIKSMLNISPEHRPQSIEEVITMIQDTKKKMDTNKTDHEKIEKFLTNINYYEKVLKECFPGKNGLIKVTDNDKITQVINKINNVSDKVNFWWTQGLSNMDFESFKNINSNLWLMDYIEIEIDEMWIFKDPYRTELSFILLKTNKMKEFGIYEQATTYRREEAAWFSGKYISRDEYDDGVTEINGEGVWLNGEAELRIRDLIPQYYFITTPFHSVGYDKNDIKVAEVYDKLMSGIKKDSEIEDILMELSSLKRHNISIYLN